MSDLEIYSGEIIEIQVLGKTDRAFGFRLGQEVSVGRGSFIKITKILRDTNWMAQYNDHRILIFAKGNDGEFLWKEFLNYPTEITYGK